MNHIRKIVFAAVLIVLASCGGTTVTQQKYAVIPRPAMLVEKQGAFTMTRSTVIIIEADNEEMRVGLENVAGFITESFKRAAGFDLKVSEEEHKSNYICFRQVEGLEKEAYRLAVTPDEITIECSASNGAFYGVQTLFQLLPAEVYSQSKTTVRRWTVPCCEIEDEPRFPYRGMHLDVCLHFFPVEYIKRYIDLMAVHKMNVFHWHLTEDQGWRIEIKRYPELTQKGAWRKETVIGTLKSGFYDGTTHGGYYTQDEIREIVKYAADRYITVIPEIEMPGHALAAIACYPELSCNPDKTYELATRWGVFRDVYCPKEETFEFLENVLTEVMELFPSEYIHIGGDECPKTSWKQCPHCQKLIARLGLADEFELQSYFIQRIEKFINSRGRKIIGWDEILQGGLAPNASVMSWLGEEGGIKAAQQHHDVVMCPHDRYYLDYYQADPRTEPLAMGHLVTLRKMYDYNPVPEVLTPEEQSYIMGVQGCVWTEYMPTPARVEYMAYPRATAIAEAGWSLAEGKDWVDYTHRLEHHFARFEALGVDACRAFFDAQISVHDDSKWSKIVTMTADVPNSEIHFTLDGSEPTASSTLYTLPFVINRSQVVRAAVFRNGDMLGKVTQREFE
jgi:hexosaminidase